MLRVFIYGDSSYKDLQYTWIASYSSKVSKSQQKPDTFESCFLVLEIVLDLLNSAKESHSSSIYLLIPLLNFLGTKKTPSKFDGKAWVTPHGFCRKSNDRVFDVDNEDLYYGIY